MAAPFITDRAYDACADPGASVTQARVLILAAEATSAELLDGFESDGFRMIEAKGLADFLFTASNGDFDLLLVDHEVCAGSGIDIRLMLETVPELLRTPILIYCVPDGSPDSRNGGHIQSISARLESEEIRLHMHACVRRYEISGSRRILALGDVELDTERLLVSRGAKRAAISFKQAKLLRYMMENPARVCSRRQLLDAVWQDSQLEEQTVTVMIVRLRKLLEQIGRPDLIKTVSKSGYLLDY